MTFKLKPHTACDFYKIGHKDMYEKGTTQVYSNFTPRSSKLASKISEVFDDKVVFFGLQGFIRWFLIDTWNEEFFNKPKSVVVEEYRSRVANALVLDNIDVSHIEALHDLGYLPIKIKALEEGELVNMKIPVLTITNTLPEFFWLPNYLESIMSSELWKSCTTATTAYQYRKLLDLYADKTGSPKEFVQWQGHDFSFRGLSGLHDAATSAAGHLLSFTGTDTIPAIDYLEDYYFGKETFIGGSVPATEHSVMCLSGKDNEIETFRRLIQDTHPTGVVSIVSDSWDYWQVITDYSKQLKDIIMSRQPNALGLNKVVFRPDSGDPVNIICGDVNAPEGSPEYKGSVECLWEIFGGTITSTGHKLLDQHVGLIYGDSITLARASEIMKRLEAKGFASANVVFGVGSFTYQYQTRDSYGFAMKATYGVVNGEGREIFKDPKTDSGTKKSAKGLLRVEKENGDYVLYDQQTIEQEQQGELKVVFEDGKLVKQLTLEQIRKNLLK